MYMACIQPCHNYSAKIVFQKYQQLFIDIFVELRLAKTGNRPKIRCRRLRRKRKGRLENERNGAQLHLWRVPPEKCHVLWLAVFGIDEDVFEVFTPDHDERHVRYALHRGRSTQAI